jgi:hypothetical protein
VTAMMRLIYLDYNASTPIDPVVAADMRPLLTDAFGNGALSSDMALFFPLADSDQVSARLG